VGTLLNIKGIGRVPVPSKGQPLSESWPRTGGHPPPPRARLAPQPPRARFAPAPAPERSFAERSSERSSQAVSVATQPDSRPYIYLYSTERTFASYMSACPPDLKGIGFFNHLFAKWPASWALQEAAISQIALHAKVVEDLAHQPDSIKRAKTAMAPSESACPPRPQHGHGVRHRAGSRSLAWAHSSCRCDAALPRSNLPPPRSHPRRAKRRGPSGWRGPRRPPCSQRGAASGRANASTGSHDPARSP